VLVCGDCAVNPNPNAEQLADIAKASAETARQFGVDPKVAMLSYSTGTSGSGADVDVVREATEIVRASNPDFAVEGPIQYDAASNMSIASTKVPVRQGLRKPVNDLSRGTTVEDIINTVAITAIQAQGM